MTKVLITGGAGFIGFHLAKFLNSQDQNVTICDNLFRGKMDDELKNLVKDGVKYVKCDLTDKKDLKKLENDYDYVYHLAAINGTEHFYNMPHEVLRVNILSAFNIIEWFASSNGKKIMFSSSSETYAGTARKFGIDIPTREDVALTIDDVFNPRFSYGGSKIAGELLFINFARKLNFDMSIIRYHNIYGPRMGFEHVIPQFSTRIIKKENPFKIFGANTTRAFCFVDDAVKATKLVMENKETNNDIIHIGNDKEEIKILDLAKKMLKIAGFDPKIQIEDAPKGSVLRRCPDISKISKIGFKPEVMLDKGLKETFEWYKKNA